MKIRRILVALDGSREAEMALPKAVELVRQNEDAKVFLIRAVDPTTLVGADASDARVAAINEAAEYLNEVAARLRGEGVRPVVRSVWYAGAGQAITEVARTVRPDVIVMASRHRNDAGRLVPGPIAGFVRDRTRMPIFFVAAGDLAEGVESNGIAARGNLMMERRIVLTEEDMAQLRELVHQGRRTSRRDQDHLDDLDRELDRAEIVASGAVSPDVVTMHSTLRVRDLDNGKSVVYTIVFPAEAEIERKRISVLAPIGTALIGYRGGDVVEWVTPGGTRRLQIEKVLFQPEAAGDADVASGRGRPREVFAA